MRPVATSAAREDELVYHSAEKIDGEVEVIFEGIMKRAASDRSAGP